MVNAPVVAQQRGIKVVESKASRPEDFASTITTRVRGCVDRLIAGAIFHGGQPRIVRVDDFMLEAIPEGPTVLIHNHDQPGVVGQVGTVLGQERASTSRACSSAWCPSAARRRCSSTCRRCRAPR